MTALVRQAQDFIEGKRAEQARAAQRVALQLCCGLDLEAIIGADEAGRATALHRLERLVERERLRGLVRHWSYDLNRHIALKQAADLLRKAPRTGAPPAGGVGVRRRAACKKTAPEGAEA